MTSMRFHRPPGHRRALAVVDLPGPAGPRLYLGGLGSATTVAFLPVVSHRLVAGSHRSLLVDLPGSGWSEHDDAFGSSIEEHADAVASVVDALDLRGLDVVGHSLGGSVAISLATRRPDLVGRLVVCEPNLDPGVGTFSAEIAGWSETDFVVVGHRVVVDGLLAAAAAGDANADEFARTVARWSPVVLHRTAVSLLADRTPTFRRQLAAIRVPRTLVMGAETATAEPDLVASGCRVVVIPDAGHVMMADNPDAFCAALSIPRP